VEGLEPNPVEVRFIAHDLVEGGALRNDARLLVGGDEQGIDVGELALGDSPGAVRFGDGKIVFGLGGITVIF